MEQKPIAKTKVTKQTTKQIIEQSKKKRKKSQTQGSEYYLATQVIKPFAIATTKTKLSLNPMVQNQKIEQKSIQNPLKFNFDQTLKQRYATKQQSKQKQPMQAFLKPYIATGSPRPRAIAAPMLAMPVPYAQQAQQRQIAPFMPWGLEAAMYRGKKKKKKSKGKQAWYVPKVDPLGLTSQFKSGDGTAMNFMYWGSGNLQDKVGYF